MVEGKIIITGGAGYVGSHLVKNLLKASYDCIVVDNLSTGFIEAIEILKKYYASDSAHLEFIKLDLSDKENLKNIFLENEIQAVIHLAAKISVDESMREPEFYAQENYLNGINLIEAMLAGGCDKIIYSSTAAVYGNPKYTPIDENHPTEPLNPYGKTKLDFEKYLSRTKNLKFVILRYFNVGGSDPEGRLGKSHLGSQDLIENIMKVALGEKERIEIFGDDYETSDGTAIRDFVHVEDVAMAHVLALEKLEALNGEIFNLGSQKGFSVKEIIETASSVVGREIPTKNAARREGDIMVSVASAKKAKEILGWDPGYSTLEQIIGSDWDWRKKHPKGYTS